MDTSRFIKHAPCPDCGSRDNLAVYTDHTYCFGCKTPHSIGQRYSEGPEKGMGRDIGGNTKSGRGLALPDDFTLHLPSSGADWVQQYITMQESIQNRIGWSDTGWNCKDKNGNLASYGPCLIFPVFSASGELTIRQGRYMGTSPLLRKYHTKGDIVNTLHILGKGDTIVVVEDLISAIKVSRHAAATPLWGSAFHDKLFHRLSRLYKNLVLWLDYDKYDYANKEGTRATSMFDNVKVIGTHQDPKACDDTTIRISVQY